MEAPQSNAARTRKAKFYILAITFVATLGGLLFGYDTGVIGGSQLYFTEYSRICGSSVSYSSRLYSLRVKNRRNPAK